MVSFCSKSEESYIDNVWVPIVPIFEDGPTSFPWLKLSTRAPEDHTKSRLPQDPLLIEYENFYLFEHVQTYFNDDNTAEVKRATQRQ